MQLTENVFLCTGAGLRLSGYTHTKLIVPRQVTFNPQNYSLFDTCDCCVIALCCALSCLKRWVQVRFSGPHIIGVQNLPKNSMQCFI